MISITTDAPNAVSCPFCGSEDIHNWSSDDHDPGKPSWSVMCYGCECEGPHTTSETEAIAAWNTRPEASPQPTGERGELVSMIRVGLRAGYHYAQSSESYSDDELQFVFTQIRTAEEALAALSRPADEGWRPIESAPKDGTLVLLFERGTDDVRETGRWRVDRERWVVNNNSFWVVEPSHWRPLPPPHAVEGEGR